VGSSRLVRTPNGITFHVSTTDLTPGHAYTLWFVAFNEPAHCAIPNECGPDDVVNAAAQPDMMHAAGRVVGGAGTATFAAPSLSLEFGGVPMLTGASKRPSARRCAR